jgi:MOSC domain-containing protein YiiM
MDIVRRFLTSDRPGIYFKVLQEGEVEAGDSIDPISKDENNITIKDIVRLYVKDNENVESMQRAIRVRLTYWLEKSFSRTDKTTYKVDK